VLTKLSRWLVARLFLPIRIRAQRNMRRLRGRIRWEGDLNSSRAGRL